MTDEAAPGDGEVEIELVGQKTALVLKCSPGAALTLCRAPGGLDSADASVSSVTSRLVGLDIDTMALIVRAGLGLSGSAVPDLEEQIYRSGLIEVRRVLASYIGRLKNGGRPIVPEVKTSPQKAA